MPLDMHLHWGFVSLWILCLVHLLAPIQGPISILFDPLHILSLPVTLPLLGALLTCVSLEQSQLYKNTVNKA